MKYLLDVNALLALGFRRHLFHERISAWLIHERPASLFTCSITELGFVRVLSQASAYGLTISQSRELLIHLKAGDKPVLRMLADDQDMSHLPQWVKTAKQTTDVHLARLAARHDVRLATFDQRIPEAYWIP